MGRPDVHSAPSFMFSMIASLGLYAVDETGPSFARAMAWIRLVKVWASLRGDDLQGLLPASLTLFPK